MCNQSGKTMKTLSKLPKKHATKIASVSDERNNGDGWWIYLKPEYADLDFDPHWDCRTIHEQTLSACIKRLKSSVIVTNENTNEKK